MNERDLLWPFFEDAHRAFVPRLQKWLAEARVPDDEADPDSSVREWVRSLGTGGWLEPCASLDVRTLALARDTLAYHSALADFAFAMQGLGSGPITLFGSDELRNAYVPRAVQGKAIAAFALSEREAGSDVGAIVTSATRDGDAYVLNGEKTWISNGGIADFYIVFARTAARAAQPGKGGSKGLSAFVVDAASAGLTIPARIETMSPHPLGTVRFESVHVPVSHRIGGEGEGFKIAMATLDVFRSTVGAAALGFARRAFDETRAHTKSRQLFGAPLADLQLTQAALAEMATDIDASALLVYRAAWAKDEGAARIRREAAMAKLFATEAAGRICDRAVQLFGGRGVTRGEIVERLYRDVRALRIYEGASEIQKIVIARAALED
jgi:acyl-CoA dehydrogenase